MPSGSPLPGSSSSSRTRPARSPGRIGKAPPGGTGAGMVKTKPWPGLPQRPGRTDTEGGVTVGLGESVTPCGAAAVGEPAEVAAPDDPVPGAARFPGLPVGRGAAMVGMPPVLAPLHDISRHIMQTEGIGQLRSRLVGIGFINSFCVYGIPGIAAQVGRTVAPIVVVRSRPRPAGVLPLRFAGQTAAQLGAEGGGIIPIQVVCRVEMGIGSGPDSAFSLPWCGVFYCLVVALGRLRASQQERLDVHPVDGE